MKKRETILSDDRRYRYTLWREWDVDLMTGCADDSPRAYGYLMVIGLNPSTADETKDDPTIRKCIGFSKRWGFGALCMTNLFAWRDTEPAKMKKATFPVGGDNDMWLRDCAAGAGMILAAWGTNGSFLERGNTVAADLQKLGHRINALKTNADGSPMHPLYVPYETPPAIWTP